MDLPIHVLPGCGPVKQQRLAQIGVTTLGHLLQLPTSHAPKGINLLQWKLLATQHIEQQKPFSTHLIESQTLSTHLSEPQKPSPLPLNPTMPLLHTSRHSWFGKISHVASRRGQIKRCIIGDALLTDYALVLLVRYARNTLQLREVVATPLAIWIAQVLWLNEEAISDDDTAMLEPLHVDILGHFELDTSAWLTTCTESQKRMIKLTCREITALATVHA